MHANHERQVRLFGGECINPGYRGRRTGTRISKQASRRRLAVIFGALLIGFATAATAFTAGHSGLTEPHVNAGANLNVLPGIGAVNLW